MGVIITIVYNDCFWISRGQIFGTFSGDSSTDTCLNHSQWIVHAYEDFSYNLTKIGNSPMKFVGGYCYGNKAIARNMDSR